MEIIQVFGVNDIKSAMKQADKTLGHSTRRGMMNAGLFVQRESQKITPVDTGTLKNSAGTRVLGSGWFTEVIVYYTAKYSIYVHERTELKHKKGKSAKFLENTVRRFKVEILKIIAGRVEMADFKDTK